MTLCSRSFRAVFCCLRCLWNTCRARWFPSRITLLKRLSARSLPDCLISDFRQSKKARLVRAFLTGTDGTFSAKTGRCKFHQRNRIPFGNVFPKNLGWYRKGATIRFSFQTRRHVRRVRQPCAARPGGEKVEAQEALPPAVVLGAESLSLMSQHFPREPAKRCFRAIVVN